VLLDTNIVIHACHPGGEWLAPWTESPQAAIASVTKIEALGFASIKPDEELAIQELFATCIVHALDDAVIDRAVRVRRRSKISAMDAIIAATALEHALALVTQNVDDFKGVEGLRIVNPFEEARRG
jgi:predicted nucleic acid-binding protein